MGRRIELGNPIKTIKKRFRDKKSVFMLPFENKKRKVSSLLKILNIFSGLYKNITPTLLKLRWGFFQKQGEIPLPRINTKN